MLERKVYVPLHMAALQYRIVASEGSGNVGPFHNLKDLDSVQGLLRFRVRTNHSNIYPGILIISLDQFFVYGDCFIESAKLIQSRAGQAILILRRSKERMRCGGPYIAKGVHREKFGFHVGHR